MTRLTSNQRSALLRLGRASGEAQRWVSVKTLGQPAAFDHLFHKGYVERQIESGPRGGERAYYKPTAEGWAVVERDRAKRFDAERKMATGTIDTRLIEARKRGAIVRVMCGKTEYRGVPGEVEREVASGVLYLRIGLRLVPLCAITEVVA